MVRVRLPGQVKDPFWVSFFNGKVHKAEGRFEVSIGGPECGHQSPRLCVLRKKHRPNLERRRRLINTTCPLPAISKPRCQLTWEPMNSGAWLLMSVTMTATSQVLLRPVGGEGLLVRSQ